MADPYTRYLPVEFQKFIEEQFYQETTEQSKLERFIDNPDFIEDPFSHVALYSDHGVPHVRDVAAQILNVLENVNGILIPFRDKGRLEFMKGYGTLVAYLHDIGMKEFSLFGRKMHPEYAAQTVYLKNFEPYIAEIWQENPGNISWRLLRLNSEGVLKQDPLVVLRELLTLSTCHSKSKIPVDILNDLSLLRSTMVKCIDTPLIDLYIQQQLKKTGESEARIKASIPSGCKNLETAHSDYYQKFHEDAFSWLEDEQSSIVELQEDIIDTIRALRCADALRKRGTIFRTSGGYEIFIDQRSANAIYALRNETDDKLFMLEGDKALNAGEANIASSEIDQNGDLRIALHRGNFKNKKINLKAAYNLAVAINDIQGDVIMSFKRGSDQDDEKLPKIYTDMKILIEGVDDNPDFSAMVCEQLVQLNPNLTNKCESVTSLQNAELDEIRRYLTGEDFEEVFKTEDDMDHFHSNLEKSGQNVAKLYKPKAFREVRVVTVDANEMLIRSGSKSGFVYIPIEVGLKVIPLGGYEVVEAKPWLPIGNTGVIRGSERNANVISEMPVRVLMVPKEVYLKYWYRPFSREDFLKKTTILDG